MEKKRLSAYSIHAWLNAYYSGAVWLWPSSFLWLGMLLKHVFQTAQVR